MSETTGKPVAEVKLDLVTNPNEKQAADAGGVAGNAAGAAYSKSVASKLHAATKIMLKSLDDLSKKHIKIKIDYVLPDLSATLDNIYKKAVRLREEAKAAGKVSGRSKSVVPFIETAAHEVKLEERGALASSLRKKRKEPKVSVPPPPTAEESTPSKESPSSSKQKAKKAPKSGPTAEEVEAVRKKAEADAKASLDTIITKSAQSVQGKTLSQIKDIVDKTGITDDERKSVGLTVPDLKRLKNRIEKRASGLRAQFTKNADPNTEIPELATFVAEATKRENDVRARFGRKVQNTKAARIKKDKELEDELEEFYFGGPTVKEATQRDTERLAEKQRISASMQDEMHRNIDDQSEADGKRLQKIKERAELSALDRKITSEDKSTEDSARLDKSVAEAKARAELRATDRRISDDDKSAEDSRKQKAREEAAAHRKVLYRIDSANTYDDKSKEDSARLDESRKRSGLHDISQSQKITDQVEGDVNRLKAREAKLKDSDKIFHQTIDESSKLDWERLQANRAEAKRKEANAKADLAVEHGMQQSAVEYAKKIYAQNKEFTNKFGEGVKLSLNELQREIQQNLKRAYAKSRPLGADGTPINGVTRTAALAGARSSVYAATTSSISAQQANIRQRSALAQSFLMGAVNVGRNTGVTTNVALNQIRTLVNTYRNLGLNQKNAINSAIAQLNHLHAVQKKISNQTKTQTTQHKGLLGQLQDAVSVASKWYIIYNSLNVVTRALSSSFRFLFSNAVEFYNAQEQQILGLRGIIDANYKIKDAQDNQLSTSDKLLYIQERSKGIWKELQTIGFSVVGTTADLLDIFNAILPRVAQLGGGLEDAKKITEGTVLAANALGISYSTARTSLVSVLNGNVRMSNAFTSAMGFSEKEVKKLIDSGELLDNLIKRMEPFKYLQREAAQTLGAKLETYRELVGQTATMIGEPLIQGVKNSITYFQDMLGYVDKITGRFVFRESTLDFLNEAKLILKDMVDMLADVGKGSVELVKTLSGKSTDSAIVKSIKEATKNSAFAFLPGVNALSAYFAYKNISSLKSPKGVDKDYILAQEKVDILRQLGSASFEQYQKALSDDTLKKDQKLLETLLSQVAEYSEKLNDADEVLRNLEDDLIAFKLEAKRDTTLEGQKKEIKDVLREIEKYKKQREASRAGVHEDPITKKQEPKYKELLDAEKVKLELLKSRYDEQVSLTKQAEDEISLLLEKGLVRREVYYDRLASIYRSQHVALQLYMSGQKAIYTEASKVTGNQATMQFGLKGLAGLPGEEATIEKRIISSEIDLSSKKYEFQKKYAETVRDLNVEFAKQTAEGQIDILKQQLERQEIAESTYRKKEYAANMAAYNAEIAKARAKVGETEKTYDIEEQQKARAELIKANQAQLNYINLTREIGKTRTRNKAIAERDYNIQLESLTIQSRISKIEADKEQGYISAGQYWDSMRRATNDLVASKNKELAIEKEKYLLYLKMGDEKQYDSGNRIQSLSADLDQLIVKQNTYNSSLLRMGSIFDSLSSIGGIDGIGVKELSAIGGAFGSLGNLSRSSKSFSNYLKTKFSKPKVQASFISGADSGVGEDVPTATVNATGALSKLMANKTIKKLFGAASKVAEGVAQAAPVIGAAVEAFQAIYGIFKSMFTRAAKKIGERISREVEDIQKSYNAETSNLVQTLNALTAARANAISQLSGKKGGQEQLDRIIPTIDNAITDLQKQQKQIFENFDDQLTLLRQPEGLRSTTSSIMQLTKTLEEYNNAGGDATKMLEYWNLSIKEIEASLQKGITDAEKEAIDRAIELNDLLEQRVEIIKNYNEEELKLTSKGSIARQLPNVLSVGKELQDLRKKRDKELENLDKQIRVNTARVDAEKQIFSITGDIASLKERSIQMEIAGNNVILEQLKQQMALLKGGFAAYATPLIPTSLSGMLGSNYTPSFSSGAATITNNFEFGPMTVVSSTNSPQEFGKQFASSLVSTLDERLQRRALY